ncbi:AraC family transcriptional regulator [Psychroflexus montanilacus]|uniref:AraC family transcriptional regulator n=1 Tax=Psychroflexus montanilacus TaxID=2873598 RepID=UPI001CCF0AB2|nr:AraC family transcriptional regulator [Psychroflexus montanilacus]MBZ9651869.1 AraC family transcriptional regulator [Psychroflexus montanilacus]
MSKNAKPILEKLEPNFGNSFSYKRFNADNQNKSDTFWHYHPELELVYVNEGSGKRLVGSHASYYRNGNLILIGSNLPHCGFTDTLEKNQRETVVQMLPSFLGDSFFEIPELKNIKKLLQRAQYGIVFHGDAKREIGSKLEALSSVTPVNRLIGLLKILSMLEQTKNYTLLNADGYILEAKLEDNQRINMIFNFVQNEFQRSITLDEISEKVNMTKPAFCRYFKKITGKTFVDFVNTYRLTHAAKMLHEKQVSILDVCFDSGFNNFSHFNKKFKAFTGRTPTQYRNELAYSVS